MKYNPDGHGRHSIRLRDYDYSTAGAYFITICTYKRQCLLGEISDGEMRLNEVGRIVQLIWEQLPDHYPHVGVDAFVIMPNHVHGIVILNETEVGAGLKPALGRIPEERAGLKPAPTDTEASRSPRDYSSVQDLLITSHK